ncbi:hypothetical protein D5E69_07975 [Rossellomorea marisflavi]|uniref:universal stress protein n=1 Tax=Rossellomorea marisflavi TaxID=189381 RepID=UPI001316F939|nr:universal stress protein [Rossellomorea marisflavi]QHA35762.1 hypothetical protein D5E69_07975 [Rossellomorea marisflavi]
MYQHILVAYDDTDGSRKALDEALKLKNQSLDTKMTILYVTDEKMPNQAVDHFTPPHAMAATSPGVDQQIVGDTALQRDPHVYDGAEERQSIQEIGEIHPVLKHVQEKLDPHKIEAEYIHLAGSEEKRICEYAAENEVDLVIMGRSGKSGMKKLMLGSVSEKVVKNCETNVLVVK